MVVQVQQLCSEHAAKLEQQQSEFQLELVAKGQEVEARSEEQQAELDLELLQCARYGETEELVQMLAAGASVNFADDGGNTALHKAAANGHADCVIRLVEAGATFGPNGSGNTPLHWAAQNGQLEAGKALLEAFTDTIDVLAKNSFGQGALSDSFRGGNTDLVALLLTHPSASEEKLMTTDYEKKVNAKKNEAKLKAGTRVRVEGLKKRQELNGQSGTCKGFHEKSGRFAIAVDDGPTVGLKLTNLVILEDPTEAADAEGAADEQEAQEGAENRHMT